MTNNIFDTLNDDERKAMEEYEDNRAVKEELLNEFISENGAFYEFFKYVSKEENKKEFTVCQRGNSQNPSIIIYHNNHKVWELYKQPKNGCRVKVNFDHARYTENYEEKLIDLNGILNANVDVKKKIMSKDKYVQSAPLKQFSEDFVKDSAKIILELMNDYFSAEKTTDYLKKGAGISSSRSKSIKIEKQYQHKLFHALKNLNDGIYVYDTEFSQKFPSTEIRNKLTKIVNEPDMLGMKFDKNGKPKSLVIMEIKSTTSACTGNSSIKKHIEGMENYAQEEFFIKKRRKEAFDIFENLQKMGCIENPKFNWEDFENIEIKPMLILTDNQYTNAKSAVDYYDNKRKNINIDELCKKYECSLYLYKNDNFTPIIE